MLNVTLHVSKCSQFSTSSAKQIESQPQQPSKSRSSPQDTPVVSSTFNPNAAEFVPLGKYDTAIRASPWSDGAQKQHLTPVTFEPAQATPTTTTSLNVNAKAFVPSVAMAGGMPVGRGVLRVEDVLQYESVLEEGPEMFDDIVDPYTIPGIMAEFEAGLDEQGVILLKTGADILVTCTQYPATFEKLCHKLRNLVDACIVRSCPAAPSALTLLALKKLCEMVILWVWNACVLCSLSFLLSFPSSSPFLPPLPLIIIIFVKIRIYAASKVEGLG